MSSSNDVGELNKAATAREFLHQRLECRTKKQSLSFGLHITISLFTFALAIVNIFSVIPVKAVSSRGGKAILYSNHFGITSENATYDYVIIGGGTAGLAIAVRLAENESLSVAVIEAGDFYEKDHGNRSVVPAYSFGADAVTSISTLHSAPLVDWAFLTEPQTAMGDQVYHYPRGRCLGGSSARIALLYQRGSTGFYDQWATDTGDASYNFSSFLPYFKKSAHFTPADSAVRAPNATVPAPHPSAFSASGGPLQISFPPFAMPFASWALPALEEEGIPSLQDMNSGNLLGEHYLQAAFASTRTNLKIYPQSMAKQILFDGKKTAIGVRVNSYGAEYFLSAKKEVILSGGAFSSPQMLMVSGIGPRNILEKYSIPIYADSPGVGQNMWDHMLFPIVHEIDVTTLNQLNDPMYKMEVEQEYIYNATGILTNMGADVLGTTIYHAACTCKMGKREDPLAVVDSKARVIGVSNLRVVDASAFALLPPGHPQSTVYALAEKIAAEILKNL